MYFNIKLISTNSAIYIVGCDEVFPIGSKIMSIYGHPSLRSKSKCIVQFDHAVDFATHHTVFHFIVGIFTIRSSDDSGVQRFILFVHNNICMPSKFHGNRMCNAELFANDKEIREICSKTWVKWSTLSRQNILKRKMLSKSRITRCSAHGRVS